MVATDRKVAKIDEGCKKGVFHLRTQFDEEFKPRLLELQEPWDRVYHEKLRTWCIKEAYRGVVEPLLDQYFELSGGPKMPPPIPPPQVSADTTKRKPTPYTVGSLEEEILVILRQFPNTTARRYAVDCLKSILQIYQS